MRRTALVLCSLLAVAFGASQAAAQRAKPVEGGGSFTDAPVLAEGYFSDTIRMTEELLYGVELAEGQALKVTAQLLGRRNAGRDVGGMGQLQVYNSLRDRWAFNELSGFDGESDSDKWRIKTPAVGSEGRGPFRDEEVFAQPGVYYFSLKFFRIIGSERDSPILKREFPTRYDVEITGSAVAPTPTPSPPSPEPSPTETEDPGGAAAPAPPDSASSDAPYVRVYLMTFLIGLLVGFGVVTVRGLAGRRASSPAPERRGT